MGLEVVSMVEQNKAVRVNTKDWCRSWKSLTHFSTEFLLIIMWNQVHSSQRAQRNSWIMSCLSSQRIVRPRAFLRLETDSNLTQFLAFKMINKLIWGRAQANISTSIITVRNMLELSYEQEFMTSALTGGSRAFCAFLVARYCRFQTHHITDAFIR